MSCVNLSEVLQKQHDVDTERLEYDLQALGIHFRGFGPEDRVVVRRSCVPGARRKDRWNGRDDRAMVRSGARRFGCRDPVTTDSGRPQLSLRTHFAGTIPWCVRKS